MMCLSDGDGVISEWEYMPPIGNRPMGGFVGLKNAGATCYMNSVLQQLYMVESIKRGVLGIIATDAEGDEGIEDSGDSSVISRCQSESSIQESVSSSGTEDRKNYNITILKQIQSIFGHLALSKLQYCVPSGLWKHFRFGDL
jgi:ubiquitin carboxyl-terminal hydrolase 9/24